ncbi:MAG: FAD:protein FMN transferase, partial [Bdellovibrionales bacterium]
MNSSKHELKRARPALGTVLLLRLFAPQTYAESAIDEVISRAFDRAEELENCFSKFRQASDVCRLNQASLNREIPVSREFAELVILAANIWQSSDGAFAPFGTSAFAKSPILLSEDRSAFFAQKTSECALDLSGIAKGFIADQLSAFILQALPEISGVINAGGDLRFFNMNDREADVRLAGNANARRMVIGQDGLATSAMSESLFNEHSTTIYPMSPRQGLTYDSAVTVIASTCA